MRKYRTSMQLIFQDPYSSLPPRMTVGSIISEAVIYHNIVPKEQVNEYVRDIMKNVDYNHNIMTVILMNFLVDNVKEFVLLEPLR